MIKERWAFSSRKAATKSNRHDRKAFRRSLGGCPVGLRVRKGIIFSIVGVSDAGLNAKSRRILPLSLFLSHCIELSFGDVHLSRNCPTATDV